MTGGGKKLLPVEKLDASHLVDSFNCGVPALDGFLRQHAMASQNARSATTYILCRENRRVVGYFSLANGSAEHKDTPSRVRKGLAQHRVPIMLLARLAVDRSEQGRGIGQALLKDAMRRTALAADIAGVRALFVQAKDNGVRDWYARFGFEASPTKPSDMFLVMKDLMKHLRISAKE